MLSNLKKFTKSSNKITFIPTLVSRKFSQTIVSGIYVPGNQERMLRKSVVSGATLIVPDIEDSVPVAEKPKARELINQFLPFIRENAIEGHSVTITPRTNQPSLPELWQEDIHALFYDQKSCPDVFDGICVPKIDQVADIKAVHDALEEYESKNK